MGTMVPEGSVQLPRTRRTYAAEFGRRRFPWSEQVAPPPGELSREFELPDPTIRNWVNQADIDDGRRDRPTSTEREEPRSSRRGTRRKPYEASTT